MSIPCPICVGHGANELLALRQLHAWCLNNIKARSKPSKEMVELVNFVLQAQGKKKI